MRSIVSYDDISLPYQPLSVDDASSQSNSSPSHHRPSAKKRKRSNNHQKQHNGKITSRTSNNEAEQGDEDYDVEEESRELTHDEIWDDSALIEAWNAATEEYEAFHGPEKDWKREPVHKSPLWYNVPPSPPTQKAKASSITNGIAKKTSFNEEDTENSTPVDFDAFVPTHDPSLGLSATGAALPDSVPELALTAPTGPLVSQDEAFSKALGAMYWAGYWTAAYHYSRQTNQSSAEGGENEDEYDEGNEVEAELVTTQQ